VLYCVHADRAFADGGGALNCFQIVDLRVNGWLVLEIFASKLDSVIDRRGMKFERDLFAGVQGGSAKASDFAYAMLKFMRRGH